MKKFVLTIAVVLCAFVMLGGVFASATDTSAPKDAPKQADKSAADAAPVAVPPITAISSDGVAKLLADAKGKVVVLNFWATWCPPCVAEIPDFARFYNETKRDQVTFISLNANDPGELRTAVTSFQKAKKLPFPIFVLNDQGGVEDLAKATKAKLSGALPTTLIYDKTGTLKSTWERDTTFDELMGAIKPLL